MKRIRIGWLMMVSVITSLIMAVPVRASQLESSVGLTLTDNGPAVVVDKPSIFPQTGEELFLWGIVMGLVLIGIALYVIVRRKRLNDKI